MIADDGFLDEFSTDPILVNFFIIISLPGRFLDCPQSHAWVAMQVQTKFLRLFGEAAIGDRIDGWRVCWIGGWVKCRVLFVVIVERPTLPIRQPGRASKS